MTEPEKFLDRWSRRKREAVEVCAPVEAKANTEAPEPRDKPPAEVPFDPASLPPIEELTAQSDIAAFLRPGVPPELTRAALRRAWSTDPAVRDFIGLVENGWDFNDPNGIPGFGPIAAEEVARLFAQAVGAPPAETAPQQIVGAPVEAEQNAPREVETPQSQQSLQEQRGSTQNLAQPDEDSVQRSEGDIATQNSSGNREDVPLFRRRGHGGALPK
jgi:hypothetical protein